MTDTAENAPVESAPIQQESPDVSNQNVVAEAVNDVDYSFVLDKYRTDGRTDQDAALEQAKAYKELQSKFGAFTGAPEEYEIQLSEGLSEKFNLEEYSEDPILNDAKEIAKELNMSSEGFNRFVELYFRGEMAGLEAADKVREEEMKALGNGAQRRLDNIESWAKMNLDSDNAQGLLDSLTTAQSVQAVEALIAKTRNVPQVQQENMAPAISADKLKEMMVAKDQYGNPKMNDPAYRSQVNKLYDQLYGAEPHKVTVG